jgi:hypothetical protein
MTYKEFLEIHADADCEFEDLSGERERTYCFSSGSELTISAPIAYLDDIRAVIITADGTFYRINTLDITYVKVIRNDGNYADYF